MALGLANAVQNLQMLYPWDWQGGQMPRSSPGGGELGAGGIDWCIMQINTQMLAQTLALSTIKRKIGDCLQFSTVAAYSFLLEDVNVSDLILGHSLFSPFSVVQIFGIFKKIY